MSRVLSAEASWAPCRGASATRVAGAHRTRADRRGGAHLVTRQRARSGVRSVSRRDPTGLCTGRRGCLVVPGHSCGHSQNEGCSCDSEFADRRAPASDAAIVVRNSCEYRNARRGVILVFHVAQVDKTVSTGALHSHVLELGQVFRGQDRGHACACCCCVHGTGCPMAACHKHFPVHELRHGAVDTMAPAWLNLM